jgi:uncharacterized protein
MARYLVGSPRYFAATTRTTTSVVAQKKKRTGSITMTVPAEEPQMTVNRFVTALVEERLDDARGLLHHELVVHEAGGLPFSGEYSGPEGFLGLLGRINEGLELVLNPTIQYLVAGDTVAMRSRMTFTARHSGKSVEVGLVEIYTVRDGKIFELEVYYQDSSAVAALLTG